MLSNSIEFGSKFSHRPMQDFASFARSMNMATQAFAIDGTNAENVQTTGTAAAVLNGVSFTVAEDAELDISADTQLGVWTTAQSYTAVDMKYVDFDGHKQWYKCIASHTSSAANKPSLVESGSPAWMDYWVKSSQTAEQASGDVVATGYSRYYLALVNSAGTLTLVKAGDVALDADVELRIPNFEPEVFVAIGTLLVDSAGFTMGTTALTGISTFAQIIGPCFPQGTSIDQN